MATVTFNNPFIKSISGSLSKDSDYSFFTMNGKIFTKKKGKRTTPYRQKELNAQQRFRQATKWANLVQSDDLLTATYRVPWKQAKDKYPSFRGFLMHYYYENYAKL